MLDGFNTRTAPVPHHVCCYGEKSDTQGEGRNGGEGRGRDLCLSCCRAACVRVRGGGLAAYCTVVEYGKSTTATLCVTMKRCEINGCEEREGEGQL